MGQMTYYEMKRKRMRKLNKSVNSRHWEEKKENKGKGNQNNT